MWQQLPTPLETAVAYQAYLRGAFSLPYFLGYFKCQYVDQSLPTGMLKQGLLKPDGTAYPEFPRLLAGIHLRLIASGGMKLIFFRRFETHGFFGGSSSDASSKKGLLRLGGFSSLVN